MYKKITVLMLLLVIPIASFAQLVLKDPKVCGFVPRGKDGLVLHSADELRKFQLIHPCPATGLKIGGCDGWSIDYVIPLSCGGCDAVVNMQWMPTSAKACTEDYCKDRYERLIQFPDPNMPGLVARTCKSRIVRIND